MVAYLTVKKGEEEQRLRFFSSYNAEEFVRFCQIYWRCCPEEEIEAYQLACPWPQVEREPPEARTELDSQTIEAMTRGINAKLYGQRRHLQVCHRGGKLGIMFFTNQNPVQSLSDLLRGLFCPPLPALG